jgi:glycerophosphoryl diester phosphodiesterase
MPELLRIGHRGAAGHAPENTLAAVQKGIELGVDFVEIDVRRTADGVLVALHDSTLNRTTNGNGRVDAFSLHELRAFDAGDGERIPTVEEVLTIAAGRTGLMLELKVASVASLTVETVQKMRFPNPVIYASFLHTELTAVRAVAPEAALMVLYDRLPRAPVAHAMPYRPRYVGLRHDRASQRLVEAFHEAHVLVCVYTPNRARDIGRVLSFGVDGVISDFPERIATSPTISWPE